MSKLRARCLRMTEMFAPTGAAVLTLPLAGTRFCAAGSDWQPSDTPGFAVRALLEDAPTALRTWLMRIEAGAFAPDHSHDEVEQIYVLDGEFYDAERVYGAGDFLVRAAGAVHSAGSHGGATMLVSYARGAA